MLKVISSKNESEIYSLAKKEKDKAKIISGFLDCEISDAQSNAENVSIFGSMDAYILRVGNGEIEKLDKKLFESLRNSEHFFVLVGSGAEFEKTVATLGEKVLKPIEKIKFDFPAELVSALQKGDKKNSWNLLLKELSTKDAEPIHGSCVFAYKSLLVYLNDPKKNSSDSGVKDFSWKQAKVQAIAGRRELEEVKNKYFGLILAYHKARNGEGDLRTQLEKWVLDN